MKKNSLSEKKRKESAILEASLRVIKQKGFHRARMSDISEEAGISYGLVYHYFKNKEDLFDAILHRWWDGLFQLMEKIIRDKDAGPQNLRRIIYYFLDTYQTHPELVHIFITEISRSTANLTNTRLEHFKKFMTLVETLIAKGQKDGIVRKDFKARYLTYIFLGSLETFISAMVLVDQRIKNDAQKERIAQSILEVFLSGAGNQKEDSPRRQDI